MTELTQNYQPVPILTYHQIAPAPEKGTGFRSLCVDPLDFQRHMAFLHGLGYTGLSMSALQPYLRGARNGKVFGITFDDGFLNNLTHALPTLQWYGFSSTCYVVSEMLGYSNSWDKSIGIPPSALMGVQHLRQWVSSGQEIGAHTRHHARLTTMDDATCLDEISRCKSDLESFIGQPVTHFCYPYGDYGPEHVSMVEQAGYVSATTTRRGRSVRGDPMLELPRVPVLRRTSRPLLWWKLVSGYEDKRHA